MRKFILVAFVAAFILLEWNPAQAVPSSSSDGGLRGVAQLLPGTVKVSKTAVQVTSGSGTEKFKTKDAKVFTQNEFATAGWFFDSAGNCVWVPDQTKYPSFGGTYKIDVKGVIAASLTPISSSTLACRGALNATLTPKGKNAAQYLAKLTFQIEAASALNTMHHTAKLTQVLTTP